VENEGFVIQGQGGVGGGGGGGNVNRVGGNGVGNSASVVSSINAKGVEGVGGGGVVGSDATILFVSDLHWWTIDVELQTEFSNMGLWKRWNFSMRRQVGSQKGAHLSFFTILLQLLAR